MWWEGVDATRFAAEIIDHAGEGIVVYDRELRYLLWNHFMEELTGLGAPQVLGHTIGDALLRLIGRRLKSCVREGDTVARVGGDEFTIVLQDLANKEDAALVARKVLQCIAEPVALNGHRLYVTTSIGITFYPDDGEDAEALLRNADNAVYVAKAEGRNTYQMSTAEMTRAMQERLVLENGLRQALERNEFVLHYQPQIDIRTMQIVGMEALLRWNHPARGILLPE